MDGTTPQIRTEDILLALIARSATNPRTTFDEDSLRELGQSMATVGQIHPALVRPRGEGFELVAGERRWRAAALAGLLTLRCEVRDLTDEQVEEIQLVENAGREDVHPLEEAVALQRCVARGRTPQYLADRLGRPVRWVQKRLALMNLIETARAWLRSERLPIAHAQQLAALAPSTQGRVLARFGANAPIPTAREFARAIGYESHAVEAAPFDTKDATLPGHGPCAKCVHRSDAQADLFEGASADALCLDAACWSQKTDATWLRVERSAAKKKLTVLADAAGVFAYGDRIDHNAPYVAEPPVEGAKPVAVVRAPSGRAVELYAKPARSGGGDDDEEDGPETDEEREERVRNETRWAEKRAAAEAEGRARAERLLAVAGTKDGVLLFLRAGLLGFLEQLEAPALRPMLALLGEPAALLAQSDDAVVVRIEDEHLLRVVAAVLADERLHTAESVEEDGAELTELDALLLERFRGDVPMPESPTLHRLWILARPFGELNEDGRAMYDHADVDLDIEWETRGEYVTAEVPEKAASIVLTLAKEDGFAVHTGAEPPPPVATTELRVIRGDWLQHRSGLRDTAKAPLHKQWEPDGDDRVVRVKRGDAVAGLVLAYCIEHGIALRVNGEQVSPKVGAPAAEKPAKKAPVEKTAPAPLARTERVADDVLAVLSTIAVDGTVARITEGTLDRKLYERVNKVLEALGGTWSKKLKGHAFADDPRDALDGVILSGEVARARDVLGWFPTPLELVKQLFELADGQPGMTLLEPSAGEGAIVGSAVVRGYKVTALEIDPGRHSTLTRRYGADIASRLGDFLRYDADERFDRVVMNPPFARQQDIEHVTAAFRLLAPGGRLIAVMSAGVAFRQDRKAVAFRELVASNEGRILDNDEGAFKESGTSVRTVTVVMNRRAVSP